MIDTENGILRSVVLLTGNKPSANGNIYTDAALNEAVSRYENSKMFIDHGRENERGRSIRDFGGVYRNVHRDGDKVRADLHLTEDKRQMILSIAKMQPNGVGLSIRDRGRGVDKNGVFLVEGFVPNVAYSTDFVADPSANKSLFESTTFEGGDADDKEEVMNWKEIKEEELKKERPDLVEAIQSEGKAAVLKDLAEARAKGDDADKAELRASKLIAIFEAKFDADVAESVRKITEPDTISLEAAKGIIEAQRMMIEAISKKLSNSDPSVKGAGKTQPKDLDESNNEVSPDDIVAAFKS
jgi:hypothetical protein